MSRPTPEKLAEWRERAARKQAIVPRYFEVFPTHVVLECGECGAAFQRNLVLNLEEPYFVCPNQSCRARNWVPVYYDLK